MSRSPRAAPRPEPLAVARSHVVVLLIEDTLSLQIAYRGMLAAAGYRILVASTAAEGMEQFASGSPEIVLLDLMLPDRDGIDLMRDMLRLRPATRIIAITANGTVNRAVEAIRAGAHEFLVKPFDAPRLILALQNAVRRGEAAAPPPAARTARIPDLVGGFLGSSEAMDRVKGKIASVAGSMATVFITGESGTGKELCALAVHQQSARANGPFIALNCGAIPQDLLESEVFGHMKGSFTGAISDKPGAAAAADGGTLFLDEVCEMVSALQTKLLRFLQTSSVLPVGATRPRKVNVRIVCATNQNPMEAVRRGQFREDLFYRLYVVPIDMPPLRERGEDVIEIAEAALRHFAAEEGRVFDGLSPEVRGLFRAHPWPGNVRQLLNVIRNVVVLNDGGIVTADMLPESLVQTAATGGLAPPPALPRPAEDDPFAGMTLAEVERRAVMAAIERHAGSVPRAARELDVAPSTLYRKLSAWGIEA